MSTVFRIFFGTKGVNEWLVLLCLLAAAIAEGVGLTALLPLLTLAQGQEAATDSPINAAFADILTALGLPTNFEVLLCLLVVSIVLKSALTLVAMRYVGYAVADVATNLQTRLTKSILRARWGYFSGQPVGRFARSGGSCPGRSAVYTKAGAAHSGRPNRPASNQRVQRLPDRSIRDSLNYEPQSKTVVAELAEALVN